MLILKIIPISSSGLDNNKVVTRHRQGAQRLKKIVTVLRSQITPAATSLPQHGNQKLPVKFANTVTTTALGIAVKPLSCERCRAHSSRLGIHQNNNTAPEKCSEKV